MHNNKRGLLEAWGIYLLSALLLGLSFSARATTSITNLTASPSSVTAGKVVAFDMTITTTALRTLAGSASAVLSRDGVTVKTVEFQGLLDRTSVGSGSIRISLPMSQADYSQPGAYALVVRISGDEDRQVSFTDSATTTFDVTQTTQPLPNIVVSPSALSIVGAPGETATGTFTITQGAGPFTVRPANSDRGSVDTPNPDVGATVTYSFRIPDTATDQQRFTDTITVTSAAGDPMAVPVTVTTDAPATPPGVVSPSTLDVSGAPGETATGTFAITQGAGPFTVQPANTDRGSVDTPNPDAGETVTYSFRIPDTATDQQQFTYTITVTPAAGDPIAVLVTVTADVPATSPGVVSPSALDISGAPGETATGTFTITQGTGPFTARPANTDRGSVDNPNLDVGETVTYSFRIPSAATDQQQFTDTISVTSAAGEPVTIPVTITASAPGGGDDASNPIDDAMESIAKTQPQRATGGVIGTICPKGIVAPRLQEDCNVVVGAALTPEGSDPHSQAATALGQVTSDQAAAPVNASQTSVAAQNRNLASRISALQQGARMGMSAGGLSFHLNGETLPAGQLTDEWMRQLTASGGGAAGSDSIFDSGRLGVFINGNISLGDKDRTANEEGFEFQTTGITLGADYRFTDQLVLGAAVGYIKNDTDLDADGGQLDADGYSLSLYGTFFQDSGLYADGMVSFGRNDYDQQRNIRYDIGSVSVDQTAASDFDGDQWSASFGGGYSFSRGALAFGPTARLEYVNAKVDAFEETMSNPIANGGGWATRIENQEMDSFNLQLGGDLSYAVSQSWGVLLPQIHMEWVHEFKDDAHNVDGHFLLDPSSTAFSLNTDSPDSDYFNVRLGVSAQFAQGRSAYIYYRKLIGYQDLDMDSFSAGVRLEF